MQMTFNQFLALQNLRVEQLGGLQGTWSILKANGKVLKRKEDGKLYEGYQTPMSAKNDLENDLVKAGVLTAI